MKNWFWPSLLILFGCTTLPKHADEVRKSQEEWNRSLEDESVDYIAWNKRIPTSLSQYKVTGTCDGLPRVDVKTAPGFCLGLVDNGENMGMPRMALALNQNQILVTDMGSWNPNIGKLYLLTWDGKKFVRKTLLDGKTMKDKKKAKIMDRPNTVLRGPDGRIYVGGATGIGVLDPLAANVESTVFIMIDNLPSEGLHPLKSFTFDSAGKRMFVNLGATTNVCQKEGYQGKRLKNCLAAESSSNGEGQIRVYQQKSNGSYDPAFQVFARGLRNSMALFWDDEQKFLLQAENGRDAIHKFDANLDTKTLPHEEFNLVTQGGHYGWPYCYDNNLKNPEWVHVSCDKYKAPIALLPAHSAPLSLIKYRGTKFPSYYKNRYLMSLHGYEAFGHRIVTFSRDDNYLPKGSPLSIVYGWDAKGEQLLGSPVGLSEMPDGSVIIVEDKSRKVLRLSYDPNEGDGAPLREIDQVKPDQPVSNEAELQAKKLRLEEKLREPEPPIFSLIQSKMIDKHCALCHGGAASPGIQLTLYDDVANAKRIRDSQKAQQIFNRVSAAPGWPMMPPQGIDSEQERKEILDLLKKWIDAAEPLP